MRPHPPRHTRRTRDVRKIPPLTGDHAILVAECREASVVETKPAFSHPPVLRIPFNGIHGRIPGDEVRNEKSTARPYILLPDQARPHECMGLLQGILLPVGVGCGRSDVEVQLRPVGDHRTVEFLSVVDLLRQLQVHPTAVFEKPDGLGFREIMADLLIGSIDGI